MSNSVNILIFDYGMGNMFSISKALEHIGANVEITSDPEKIKATDYLVLPGVGAFGKAMENLTEMNAVTPLREYLKSGKKFLGICLGFQLLFETSNEFGNTEGLAAFDGEIKNFDSEVEGRKIKVPHIGWEHVRPQKNEGAISTIEKEQNCFYFVHSYYAQPKDNEIISSLSDYEGFEYCSSIESGNILACQFHPEKSGNIGLNLLKNWIQK